MMTSPAPKLPVVGFIILGVTLLLGAVGMLGATVILFKHFPAGAPVYLVPLLALNGLLGLILAVFCGLSAWKLGRQRPKALGFSGLTWALVAGFVVWMLAADWIAGWSNGAGAEVVIWTILEVLIANYLVKARRAG